MVAAIFALAMLPFVYWAAEAIWFTPADIAIPRNTAINDSAAAKEIEFITRETAVKNPWYRAILEDDHPVIATNESYFIGQLSDKSAIVLEVEEFRDLFESRTILIFRGLDKNLAKPLKWEEHYPISRNYAFRCLAEKEIIFGYNAWIVVFFSLLVAIILLLLALAAWGW